MVLNNSGNKNFLILFMLVAPVFAERLPRSYSSTDAQVYFIHPKDGAVLSNPIHVVFGLKGMGVAPAGIEKEGTGHHHLLIDVATIDYGLPIGKDAQHRHFGDGQTEAMIELVPGEHSLQLLLADHLHIPHKPPVISEKITITVE